jgi:parallel beta-helix repeat protein
VIANNFFDGGWNGVWVGSRMGENVYPMQCSNEPFYEAGFVQYTLDRADDNTVRNNTFLNTDYGIRVEDDGTDVLDNTFSGSSGSHHAIIVGTPYRTQYLDDPIRDTTVTGNVSRITGNPNPFRWVHGVENLVDQDNVALGNVTPFCEGMPPPRGPFLMSLEIGFPNPDGSIPTRPDLKKPVLGPLPACS